VTPIEKKVKCPHCGYEMPITYDENSESKGVFVICKGRKCKKKFEIKIEKVK
jgi:transcription elongation factor Elf1